jgi:hypothetical protein
MFARGFTHGHFVYIEPGAPFLYHQPEPAAKQATSSAIVKKNVIIAL